MTGNTADRPTTEPRASADYVAGFRAGRDAEHERAEAAQGAAPRAEGLDVERLWKVMESIGVTHRGDWVSFERPDAERIAREYARLSRPSDERVPESEEPR